MATIRLQLTCIFISGLRVSEEVVEVITPSPNSLQSLLEDVPLSDKWAVESLSCTDNGQNVAAVILRGDARGISNGSFKDCLGTSAFTLMGKDAKKSTTGINAVPGDARDQSAYRSKLAGVSGMIAVISVICTYHDIRSGSITLGLDGEQALKSAAGKWLLRPSQPDVDLLRDIRAKLSRLPITVQWYWIPSHQDNSIDYQDLDEWAKANVRMDALAKRYRKLLHKHGYQPQPLRFSDEGWSILYRGLKLSKLNKK